MDFINGNREYALVEKLSFTRVCGTAEERRAADILQEEFRSFGLQAHTEEFPITVGNVDRAELEVLSPYHKTYVTGGYRFAPSSSPSGDEYELIYLETTDEVALRRAKGKLVLLNDARVNGELYEKLIKAGAAGFLTMSGNIDDDPAKTDLDHRRLSEHLRSFGLIPGLHIRMTDAEELVRRGADKVRLTLRTSESELKSQNVVAEIPGSDLADEIIVLGGHYDSTWLSKGAWDNAAGVALILELARYFAANPPRRTLRFVCFGAEEIGLEGSKAYVKQHADELEKIIFMLNADVGGSVLGRNSASVTADESLVTWLRYLAGECGFLLDIRHGIMSSDSTSFAKAGVPALSFARGGVHGMGVMHTHGDNMSLIGAEALASTARIALETMKRLAAADTFPVPRKLPEKIQEDLNKYGK